MSVGYAQRPIFVTRVKLKKKKKPFPNEFRQKFSFYIYRYLAGEYSFRLMSAKKKSLIRLLRVYTLIIVVIMNDIVTHYQITLHFLRTMQKKEPKKARMFFFGCCCRAVVVKLLKRIVIH